MSDSPRHEIEIICTEQWDKSLLNGLSQLHRGRHAEGKWSGRWNTAIDYWRWKLAQAPAGPSLGAIAIADGEVVGSAIVTFKYLLLDGVKLRIGELGDLSVAPSHRGKGLFRTMLLAVVERAARDTELLYCMPNKTGVRAVAATGTLSIEPQLLHRTWLRPIILPAKSSSLSAMQSECPAFADTSHFLRPDFDQQQMDYRIKLHPDAAQYRCFGARNGSVVVAKMAQMRGRPVLLMGRIQEKTLGDYRACLDSAVRAARIAGCFFVAGWAPASQCLSARLASRMFVPVQAKQVLIGGKISQVLRRRLGALRLEMLDSDKI